MPDYKEIYARHADQYEQLVLLEDYQHNLAPALNQIRPLVGLDVVELGAGTGRLTGLIAPVVKTIQVFDDSQHMLQVAKAKLERSRLRHWHVAVADHRRLPVSNACADLVLAGWTIGHLIAWNPATWRDEVMCILDQVQRVLRPGGTSLILETLGTGYAIPHPPDGLIPYYLFLRESGFSSTWIRTDFQFQSPTEAEALLGFFFGDAMAEQMVKENGTVVLECTGIWWLSV
jgi:ubiquinone/menaquinone biosynthesis C-methylase UbiE